MAWDIALNNRHTLRGGIVTGDDEILQRLWIRLNKELGEWFLNTDSGLPWYQGGYGMLGAKPSRKNEIDLLIRQEIAETQGVLQILKYKTLYVTGSRIYDAYCSILLQSRRTVEISFGVSMQSGGQGMPIIPASFIRFESGKTLQELYDSGELKGDPGLDGVAATVEVGDTTTVSPGGEAWVINKGGNTHAVLDFGIPAGVEGADGADGIAGISPTVTIGLTTTIEAGKNAKVTNTGDEVNAVLEFEIPQGVSGVDGEGATIDVGFVTTGEPGDPAEVRNVGTVTHALLDFTIPRGASGEGANIDIDGGSTIKVSSKVEDGTTIYTLGVNDNAHKHTVANITNIGTANVATATKLTTARTISLGGGLSGSVVFDGSGNVTMDNAELLSAMWGPTVSTSAGGSYKVAELDYPGKYMRPMVYGLLMRTRYSNPAARAPGLAQIQWQVHPDGDSVRIGSGTLTCILGTESFNILQLNLYYKDARAELWFTDPGGAVYNDYKFVQLDSNDGGVGYYPGQWVILHRSPIATLPGADWTKIPMKITDMHLNGGLIT